MLYVFSFQYFVFNYSILVFTVGFTFFFFFLQLIRIIVKVNSFILLFSLLLQTMSHSLGGLDELTKHTPIGVVHQQMLQNVNVDLKETVLILNITATVMLIGMNGNIIKTNKVKKCVCVCECMCSFIYIIKVQLTQSVCL